MIARAMPPGSGRGQQTGHLLRRQIITVPLMGIDGRDPVTLDETPVGAGLGHAILPLQILSAALPTLYETLFL